MDDTSIKNFWEWFSNNAEDYFYFEKNQDVLFSNLHASLSKVHPDLVFEFSQVLEDGTKELVISADGIKSLFPIVVNLVSQAPFFKKWTIIAFRQPRNFTQIIYQNVKINLSDAFFKYEKMDGKIHLELYLRNFSDSEEWQTATFILLDHLLGEFYTEMTLGHIEIKRLDEKNMDELLPIKDLVEIVYDNHRSPTAQMFQRLKKYILRFARFRPYSFLNN
ncbi:MULTISPECIES: hypothetical protein [Parachlamydia]|uniref:hypothetical protein n=1 Tax=Parachlamydia TaxID=83551 RepID=UPI000A669B0B|nr:hypothetical protein [Parachlamydia acanthamoebae]